MTVAQNWREKPPGTAYDMVADESDFEPTMFPASDTPGRDKAQLAGALGCNFTDVRMTTLWLVWDPADAEMRWREERCECDDPHYGAAVANCPSTEAATDLYDFWDESGAYCPWREVKRGTPGAVKFVRGRCS